MRTLLLLAVTCVLLLIASSPCKSEEISFRVMSPPPPVSQAAPCELLDFRLLGLPAAARPQLRFALMSPELPAVVSPAVKLFEDPRPVVWFYPAPAPIRCPPCNLVKDIARRDALAKELPFRLLEGKAPRPLASWPTLHWNNADGKGVMQPWPGSLEALVEQWRNTQLKGLAKQKPGGSPPGA
jgi:hypothetical protein